MATLRERRCFALLLAAVMVAGCGPAQSSGSATSPASTALTAGRTKQPHRCADAVGTTSTAPSRGSDGFPGTILVGPPTDTGATVSLLSSAALEAYVEYGASDQSLTARTAEASLTPGRPASLALTGLRADSAVFYRVRYRTGGSGEFAVGAQHAFGTQRAPGSGFTFAVEADPHVDVDQKMQPDLFCAELANVAAAHPDFLIDLGDTFLGDKFARSAEELDRQYVAVRDYFATVGPDVPLYLVNGNHEGEDGWTLDGTPNNLTVWAANARKTYFPTPAAGAFYSGSDASIPQIGESDSFYAWTWGDALFVVLDPYTYTTTNPKQSGDPWDWTLGEAQYRWLTDVLSTSGAKYKFVFSHHALGDVRGGIEWAGLYEWGGHDQSGVYEFDGRRPGWGLPIQQLFAKYGVTIFFQGHDHCFVRQEEDGVVYQEVPQPATIGDPQTVLHEGAYRSGTILPSPGHLNVTVDAAGVRVDYIRSGVGQTETVGYHNGDVVYSYTLRAAGPR